MCVHIRPPSIPMAVPCNLLYISHFPLWFGFFGLVALDSQGINNFCLIRLEIENDLELE